MNKLTEELIKPFLNEIRNDKKIKTVIGIYPGRFQPAGVHHAKTFKWLQKKFGKNTFIATSNKQEPSKSPLNFKEKQMVWKKHGVSSSKVVQVKNPYLAEEILKKYDPETTAVVFIFGEKDAGRLSGGKKASGGAKYFQPLKNIKDVKGYEEHGYFLVAPHISIKVGGKEISGTMMRNSLGTLKLDTDIKKGLFKDIFGWYDDKLFSLLTKRFEKSVREISESLPTKVSDKYKKVKPADPKDKKKFKQFIKHHRYHSGPHIDGLESEPETYDFDDSDESKPGVQKRKKDKKKRGYEPVTEDVSRGQLSQVEKYLDKLWGKVGIDVEFTRHFLDRVNDKRNIKPISSAEVIKIFRQTYKKYGKVISKLGKDAQAVMKDMKTDVNVPFVLKWNGNEFEMIAKTIMRKKNFKSSNKKFAVEGWLEKGSKKDKALKLKIAKLYSKAFKQMPGSPNQEKIKKEIEKLRNQLSEGVDLPIEIGDTVLMGKFKNKKVVIKTIGWNEKGDLLINGKSAMRMRIPKKPNIFDENIDEFLTTIDMDEIIKEASTVTLSGIQAVDSGPNALMKGMGGYAGRNKKQAEQLGWEVIDYILDVDIKNIPPHKKEFSNDRVNSVSYLPAGIGTGKTPNNQDNLTGVQGYNKWVKNMKKVAQSVGFKLMNFMDKQEKETKKQISKDTTAILKQQKSDEKEVEKVSKDVKVEESAFTEEWWKDLLTEGGAYVECKECGKELKEINNSHLKKHNITREEYKEKYPNAELICEDRRKQCSKGGYVAGKGNKGNKRPDLVLRNKSVENRERVSKSLKETYKNNEELRLSKREITSKHGFDTDVFKEKMYESGKWTRPEDKDEFELYRENVRKLTNENYQKHFYDIPNAKKRSRDWHLDHKVSISYGFNNNVPIEVIAHHKNLEVIHHSLNESKFTKNSISLKELLKDIKGTLLIEGGAAGHMNHPFDDKDLTFGDLKKIIELGFGGQLNREDNVTEKMDGQNLMVSWKDGKLLIARNKGHIKNFGKTALDVKGIKSKFEGRGDISDAFGFAVTDIQKGVKKLSQKQKDKIFNEGQHWMNLEVMWPASANVIDYDVTQIVFHGALRYDEKGNVIGEVKGSGSILAGMLKQINQHIQKKYALGSPHFLKVPKHQDFGKMKGKYSSRVSKLQSEFGLKDSDTLALYHQSWWESFIRKQNKKVSEKVLKGLTKRWAFFDKSYKVPMIKNDIEDEKFLDWVLSFDKKDHAKQVKTNMRPFEILFFEVGAEIMKNMSGFIAANPDKAVQGIKNRIDKAVSDVKKGGDLKKLNTLNVQMDRLNAIGGFKAIVPSEGIVFKYKGNTYKFTGAFAPANQIAGLMNF